MNTKSNASLCYLNLSVNLAKDWFLACTLLPPSNNDRLASSLQPCPQMSIPRWVKSYQYRRIEAYSIIRATKE